MIAILIVVSLIVICVVGAQIAMKKDIYGFIVGSIKPLLMMVG